MPPCHLVERLHPEIEPVGDVHGAVPDGQALRQAQGARGRRQEGGPGRRVADVPPCHQLAVYRALVRGILDQAQVDVALCRHLPGQGAILKVDRNVAAARVGHQYGAVPALGEANRELELHWEGVADLARQRESLAPVRHGLPGRAGKVRRRARRQLGNVDRGGRAGRGGRAAERHGVLGSAATSHRDDGPRAARREGEVGIVRRVCVHGARVRHEYLVARRYLGRVDHCVHARHC